MWSTARTAAFILVLHALVVAGALAGAIRHGWAQASACAPAPAILGALRERYHEVDVGGGQVDGRTVVRIFAAPDGKTFTVLVITATGLACVIAAGRDFEVAPPPVGKES